MKLKEIYGLAIEFGIKNDPRGPNTPKDELKKAKAVYEKLDKDEKAEFDTDRLANPFADTRILYGDGGTTVKNLLAGIDVEVGEILLADKLRDKGQAIDLVLAHHPEAKALAGLPDVMPIQTDMWNAVGVPINVGEALMDERKNEVMRGILPVNKERAVDAARLLDMPFMCCHTPADNAVTSFLQKRLDKEKSGTVKDIVDILKTIPEYKQAAVNGAPPTVITGKTANRAGKILVDMTGGTGGPPKVIGKLVAAGVGSLVVMHMNERTRKEAAKNHLNVIVAGHIASDSIGLNLFLDELEKRGVGVSAFSGLLRVKRK